MKIQWHWGASLPWMNPGCMRPAWGCSICVPFWDDKKEFFTVKSTANKGWNATKMCSKQSFPPWCFTNKADAIFCKFETHELDAATQNTPCCVKCSNGIDISIDKIAHTVRMFCHCNVLLSPQVHMIVQHRDRTRRGNSSFHSLLVFRIRSCVLFLGMHISSRSRTRDTTLIRGPNHG